MEDSNPSELFLRVEIDRRINFAMQQNDVPVVKAAHVENSSAALLQDLRLRIVPEPDFAEPWEARIDRIAAGSTYDLGSVDLVLSPRYLIEITERTRGQLRFELWQGGEQLLERLESVYLLARDEWSGISSLPEILAAFVMPNHPEVEHILREAAKILQDWTGDPSLSGYQTKDPKRVYTMAAAVYTAIQRLDLTYVNPPASFETEGQRIRFPDRIEESRMGTCLDLAVLAAGCLEQAGLNPFVVIVQGHAFSGLWLHEACFGEPVIEEPLRLRKRVDLDEIVVFDPTCVTHRPRFDFGGSVAAAKRRLGNPEEFLCAIDICRARKGQIRPIPERVERTTPNQEGAGEGAAGTATPPAPDASALWSPAAPAGSRAEQSAETPATRLDRWRLRLLDLSLRNRLLNFRETKKTIPLLCPDLAAFEDALAEGATFHILPLPRDLGEGDPRDPEAYRRRTGEDAVGALLREELRAGQLRADLSAEDLDRRLLEVYRTARLGLEEGGASALYLGLGFLSWYEAPQSSQRRLAPILLLPLQLQRKSLQEGYTLRLGEDEPRLNVTLLELLRKDHGIVVPIPDPLPMDESGLDVSGILHTFREAIRDVDRWDVLDVARIGIFSFAKFLMWRDLTERTDDLMNNPVVEHLVNNPEQEFDPGATFPDPDRLDKEHSPLQAYCPLPADSSQLAAVFAAADGRSFVLEGPPGTGKSQTITNLIAHCLAEGKTVLFVSEKMAALHVVHDRLQKVGLGRSCLELHSNKAQKQQVLAQLGEVLDHYGSQPPEEWEREARRLQGLRNELNAYVEALHKRRRIGETVFQATSKLIGLRDAPIVQLRWPSPDALDGEGLAGLRELVDRLAAAAGSLSEVPGHPWEAVRRGEWTPVWEQELRRALERLSESVEILAKLARTVSARVTIRESAWRWNELKFLDELVGVLLDSPDPPEAILVRPDWDAIHDKIGVWIEHGQRRDGLRREVFGHFTEGILSLDLDGLHARLGKAERVWWPASWWHRRSVRKELKPVSRAKNSLYRVGLGPLLDKARSLRAEEKALAAAGDEARSLLGQYWRDGEAGWEDLKTVCDWAARFRRLAARAAGSDFDRGAAFRQHWARLATEGRDLLRRDGEIGRELLGYRSAYEDFQETRKVVDGLLDLDTNRAWGRPEEPDALGKVRRTLRGWSEHAAQLRAWCAWRRVRKEAVAANLTLLVEACERGDVQSPDLRRVFERSFYQWWHSEVVSAEPVLAEFFSPEHEHKIQHFCEVDSRYINLTRQLIPARLARKVPASDSTDLGNSEVGILKREVAKRRRQMSLRKLFGIIPNLLPRLKPCLLMSPMSVAQYLDPGYPLFDLVVFDEASQIPIWDAVGAIARGKQAVIVGDPKQLPPTNFFHRVEDDEEEEGESDAVEDLESILDDCDSARLPSRTLNWHYRSRHESLIAFSNYYYYDNRLLTFPSPYREGMGVSWRHVPEGVYDRGKSSTNRGEADAIVQEILRRLRDDNLSAWSIGVVTFSQAQQTLIEDLLEEVRRTDLAVDSFFSEDAAEPVFVKNLENVQGDERDVILFSICYGPDALGRVALNFGPMNRDGGERRLNVAITRARREVVVFSTLRADQIDLSRSRARGIRDLKNFLEYAEHGPAAIARRCEYDAEADFDSPFEKAVYDRLVDKGWEVHRQVGCAKYRIDLAVVDPQASGRYLLGIECDGANYHRAKTARDRDKLREGILRDLGWQLHRIWSTDWWTSPEQEMQKLEAALEEAARKTKEQPAPSEDLVVAEGRGAIIASAPASAPATKRSESRPASPPLVDLPTYMPYTVKKTLGTPQDFYEPSAAGNIRQIIREVVNQEGPISLGLATRRIAPHWGLGKVHAKALQRVRSLVPKDKVFLQSSSAGVFMWRAEVDPGTYKDFRVSDANPESVRNPEDLPLEEIANAALFLLRRYVSAPKDDLIRETGRLFGFRRTGKSVEDRMRAGIDLLTERGAARSHNGGVILEDG